MGGRGGAGGGSGGERVGIKLPQILGSEKQINWAKDILTDPYKTFDMNENCVGAKALDALKLMK